MLMPRQTNPDGSLLYPETDGQPMSDNTRQFRWILVTFEELEVERQKAEQRAKHAEQWAKHAEQRAARLGELSRKVLQQQATSEEVQELERLLQPLSPNAS
jgi:hypothetical protein